MKLLISCVRTMLESAMDMETVGVSLFNFPMLLTLDCSVTDTSMGKSLRYCLKCGIGYGEFAGLCTDSILHNV